MDQHAHQSSKTALCSAVETGAQTKEKEKQCAFLEMLETLGLKGYYPQKMKKGDVCVIDRLLENSSKRERDSQLGLCYIRQLMILDTGARYIGRKLSDTMCVEQCRNDESYEDFVNVETEYTEEDGNKGIHPMDIHIAVFLCADDFLRQYICTKLDMCQFAVPLLIPDPCTGEVEFPLWALRLIKKSWKCIQGSADSATEQYDDRIMCNTSVPIVSFIRLGSSSCSKSQILNNVISRQKHDVFFHRHCRGSIPDRLLMDGVVELSWYFPGGRKDDIFDSCVAFMNLHGDASKHPRQLQFLQDVSTVNVVLLSETRLDEEANEVCKALFESTVPLICLFSGKEKIAPGPNRTKVRLAIKNRNEALLSDEITHYIKQCFGYQPQEKSKQGKIMSLEQCLETAKKQQFKIDEEKNACKEGHARSEIFIPMLDNTETPNSKQKWFPLQGEMWKEWCRLDKKQNRLECRTSENMEQQLCNIKADKDKIRQNQLELASQPNILMQFFLECLSTFTYSQDIHLYMLQWLRLCLNNKTTEDMQRSPADYQDVQNEFPSDKIVTTPSQALKGKKGKTLELHDFLREAAQMYEAAQTSSIPDKREQPPISLLPAIAAEMLMLGLPLELMDGENAHVPLVWISSVLDELITKLGDKRVFVLSVVGLQSSGKSTLLNTMFGLEFAVSAGRCTRGAFMQLLTVDEEMREQLKYDLVLVVDSEGLRSPELMNNMVHHDNELATFVIGISDLTLINIMGECLSEMQDILEICVHAFLRMKQVRITPSLIFVHQNVADVSAFDKNRKAKRCLSEKLDEMACIAAKQENFEVKGFSDVIQFDVDTQVFYFKNLLQGDPPMASPNPTYSQNTQELKAKLLSIAQWNPDHRFSTLAAFKFRVQDLWQALLAENFVFSFTNTLETSVNLALEERCVEWARRMRQRASEIQNELTNANNLIHDVDLTHTKLDEIYSTIYTEMENYFKNEKHSDILGQFKLATMKRFDSLRSDVENEIKSSFKDTISLAKSRTEVDVKKRKYESKLLEMSKSLASKLKDKNLSSEKIKNEFDKLWQEWMEQIQTDTISWKNENVAKIVHEQLMVNFEHVPKIYERIKNATKNFQFNKCDHFYSSWKIVMSGAPLFTSGSPHEENINKLTQKIQEYVQKYIERKEEKKMDFNPNFTHEILDIIKDHIAEAKKTETKVTENYTIDLSISLCKLAAERFQTMHNEFKKINDPVIVLQNQREEYWQVFEKFCQGATAATFSAYILCNKLKSAIQQRLCDKTIVEVIELLRSNCIEFKSKSNLETHIMRHLAKTENFDLFREYLENPRSFFKMIIQENVDKNLMELNLLVILASNLQSLQELILEKIEVTDLKGGKLFLWLDTFCNEVGAHVRLPRNELQSIEREQIQDAIFFKQTLKTSFAKECDSLKTEYARTISTELINFRERAVEHFTEELSGCQEQCPFCKVTCSRADPNHEGDHIAHFHRPQALATWVYTPQNFLERIFTSKVMVCSVRESFEMEVHRHLEDKFCVWTWQLRKHALQKQFEFHNQIQNGIKKTCFNSDFDFEQIKIDVKKSIYENVKEGHESCLKDIFHTKFKKRYEKEIERLLEEVGVQKKALKKNKMYTKTIQGKCQNEAVLLQNMKTLASKLKEEKISDEIIEREFDHLWSEWFHGVSSHGINEEYTDVNAQINKILQETFGIDADIRNKVTDENSTFKFSKKYVTCVTSYSSHVPLYETFLNFLSFRPNEWYIKQKLKKIENSVMKNIEICREIGSDFDPEFIQSILCTVESKLHKYQKKIQSLSFTQEMKCDFSVHLCTLAAPKLAEMHHRFRESKNPASFFHRMKGEYFNVFKNLCQEAATTTTTFFVDVLCSKLKPAIQKAMYHKASVQVVDEFINKSQYLSQSTSSMEKALWQSFQNTDDSEIYAAKIKENINLNSKRDVEQYCTTSNNLARIINQNLDDIQKDISSRIEASITTVKEKGSHPSVWLDELCRSIGSVIAFPRDDLKNIDNVVDGNIKTIKNPLKKALNSMWEDLKKDCTKDIHMQEIQKKAIQILSQHLTERWEKCKLCKKSVCEVDSADKPHHFSVSFCTTMVSSKGTFMPGNGLNKKIACNRYRQAGMPYEKWQITPKGEGNLYWKWFICRFKDNLETKFNKKFEGPGSIPEAWTQISKTEALAELDKLNKLK